MIIVSKFAARCRKCGGAIAVGQQVEWERGAGVRHVGECPSNEVPKEVTVTAGVFRKDGKIFVVKPNREKSRLYAKEIVETAPRMTESGLKVDFETIYRPGAIYDLKESDRWELADAQDFLTKYARCIVCGAHLKAEKSVRGAIGPVCAKYFASTKACNHNHDAAVAASNAVDEARQAELLKLSADERALKARLEEMEADDRRREAAEPGLTCFSLVTDLDHWRKSGVTTVAQLEEYLDGCAAREAQKASWDLDDREETGAMSDAEASAANVFGVKLSPESLARISQLNGGAR